MSLGFKISNLEKNYLPDKIAVAGKSAYNFFKKQGIPNNKLIEINFNLKTEYYHLSSPAKVERHAKEILKMVEITKAANINYEK